MKALLINPPRHNPLKSNVPSWVELDTGAYPPLGLLYVAAAAREWTDWDVSVLDAQAPNLSFDDVEERLRNEQPDVVGIQAMTFNLIDVRETSEAVRRVLPKAHICIGGPHAHLYPEETLRLGIADSVVMGEGERPFAELLKSLGAGGQICSQPGLAFLRDGAMVKMDPVMVEDLDSLPMPDRSMLPLKEYTSALATQSPITTMMSSRGCPYKCIFCDRPHLGKKFRARSATSVVAEMENCAGLGIREIFFYDDTFTVDRQRVLDICKLIRDRGIKIQWDIRARVNTVDRDVLRQLRAAGCVRIHYGVEAGTERILRVLRKGIDLKLVKKVMQWTREAGITSLAYFMIGNPTETREEIEATLACARQIRPDFIHLSVTTPFPGTELYFMALREGLIEKDCWKEFASDPTPDFVPPLWLENFTRDELLALLERGYREFYLRPGYVLRSLIRVRSPSELWRKAKAGLGLFSSKGERAKDPVENH